MDPKGFLLDEDRGVSPVIGVILMVAITVILAAVIATFVMNMGPTETTMPNAQFNFDADDTSGNDQIDTVEIEHNGGGAVDSDNVDIQADDDGGTPTINSFSMTEISAGDTTTVTGSDLTSVQIIWKNPDSGETQIMAEWEN